MNGSTPAGSTHNLAGDSTALIDHAVRMHEEEREVAERFATRGRLVIARCVGILGILGVTLYISPNDILSDDSVSMPTKEFLWEAICMGFVLLGTLHSLFAVIVYLSHHEDESRNVFNRTSFSELATRWFRVQPSVDSVQEAYLFETIQRDLRYSELKLLYNIIIKKSNRSLLCTMICSPLLFISVRFRKILIWRLRYRIIYRGVRASIYNTGSKNVAYRLCMWCIVRIVAAIVWLHYQIPGMHVYKEYSYAILKEFRRINRIMLSRLVLQRYCREYSTSDGRLPKWIDEYSGREFPGGFRLKWNWQELRDHVLMHPKYMVISDTYYTQLAEGYCINSIGIAAENKKRVGQSDERSHIEFYLEKDTSTNITDTILSGTIWRIVVSEYVASQQLRTKNWNMHYRVKQSERLLMRGTVLIVLGLLLLLAYNVISSISQAA